MASAAANPGYETVAFGSEGWEAAVSAGLRADGVVVISGVLADAECHQRMSDLVGHFSALCPAVTDEPSTWTKDNLPAGPRDGLFQTLVGQFPTVWHLRSDHRVREVFTHAYSGLREYPVDDFTVSCDGINVRPNIGPFHDRKTQDWAHLDQTIRDKPFECVQGQLVLSNSTACFRCSPKSHLIHTQILDKVGCYNNTNWCKFEQKAYPELARMVEEVGGQWQIPVQVPRGSMILWLSSTVHSARLQLPHSPVDKSDKWSQWRGVVYICYRPKAEVDKKHLQRIKQAFEENRCTNHWGQKLFPKRPRFDKKARHAAIERLLDEPTLAYQKDELKPDEGEATPFFTRS